MLEASNEDNILSDSSVEIERYKMNALENRVFQKRI